jgi:hypothetical protein
MYLTGPFWETSKSSGEERVTLPHKDFYLILFYGDYPFLCVFCVFAYGSCLIEEP